MTILQSITKAISSDTKLPSRFSGGITSAGAVARQPRVNTTEELVSSIRAYAKDNPEIAEFVKQLDQMDPKYLGLAQDVIDLSGYFKFNPFTNINILEKATEDKSYMGFILNQLPAVSKKNPAALDLTETVINNSDETNAKYFLIKFFSYALDKMGALSEQMKAVKEVVPIIAKDTLTGGSIVDFSKNQEFFDFIKVLSAADSKPENIKLLNPIYNIIQKLCKNTTPNCNLSEIRHGDTATINKNLDALPYLIENAEAMGAKEVDISGFLTKTV